MAVTVSTSDYLSGVVTGWLVSQPGQYEFGGLLMGRGTPYVVESVTGLFGYEGGSEDVRRSSGPGSISGLLTPNSKTIEMDIKIDSEWGAENIEQCIEECSRAFQPPPAKFNRYVGDFAVHGRIPLQDRTQLAFRRNGYDKTRVIYCRVMRRSLPTDYELALGFGRLSVQLVADDPITYSMFPKVTTIRMGAGDLDSGLIPMTNEGSFAEGYAPYISVGGNSGPAGFKNPEFSRRTPDPFHPGQFLYEKVSYAANFPTAGSPGIHPWLGVSFRDRTTTPLTIAHFLNDQNWWRSIGGGDQWFRFRRSTWGGNSAITVKLITRDTWLS